jgi:hypothetical protein
LWEIFFAKARKIIDYFKISSYIASLHKISRHNYQDLSRLGVRLSKQRKCLSFACKGWIRKRIITRNKRNVREQIFFVAQTFLSVPHLTPLGVITTLKIIRCAHF